jgi:type VI secretion system protein VasJ
MTQPDKPFPGSSCRRKSARSAIQVFLMIVLNSYKKGSNGVDHMDIQSLGTTPVPGTSPAGQDARYDDDYARLQAEIDKLNSVTHVGEVDWKKVVDMAAAILEGKSKDLLVACYMSVGLMQIQDLPGLITGTKVLHDLVATFWDTCYPPKKRLRGRMNTLSWWQEKTLAWVKARPTDPPVPAETREAVISNVKQLDQSLGELLPDLPPMRDLMAALDRLPVEQPVRAEQDEPSRQETEEQAPPQPRQDAPQQVQSTPAPSQSNPPGQGSAAATPEDTAMARKILSEAALSFANLARGEHFADPWIWKAARLAAWGNVHALPPSQSGQTMIPPPDASIKAALLQQIRDGRAREAATAAEERFTGAIFWLDLQRIIATALRALGPDFALAEEAVRVEMAAMVRRFTGLEQLAFADGTPFADAETKAWLTSISVGPEKEQSSQDKRKSAIQTVLEQAEARQAKKDEAGALDLITQAMLRVADRPSRLRLRIGQVNLLCRAQRFPLATALAEEMLAELDARELTVWDPELALDILRACHEAFVGLGDETGLARARDVAVRISRIRPSAALNLAL